MDEQFWANVKARRISLGFSQADLAAKVGLHQTGLSYFESCKSKRVDPELKSKIALALDTTVASLQGTGGSNRFNFPEEIQRWLESEESKNYIVEAYHKYITDKMKSLE